MLGREGVGGARSAGRVGTGATVVGWAGGGAAVVSMAMTVAAARRACESHFGRDASGPMRAARESPRVAISEQGHGCMDVNFGLRQPRGWGRALQAASSTERSWVTRKKEKQWHRVVPAGLRRSRAAPQCSKASMYFAGTTVPGGETVANLDTQHHVVSAGYMHTAGRIRCGR